MRTQSLYTNVPILSFVRYYIYLIDYNDFANIFAVTGLFAHVFANGSDSMENLGLATSRTECAPLDASPLCSPQGLLHITAQEVATQRFLFSSHLPANKFAEMQ